MRRLKPPWSGMTVALTLGTTLSVAGAGAVGAYLYSVRHSRSLLATARETAVTQGELIQAALEHQMMEDDRTLIARMIESFGRQSHLEQVVLLDREGVARFSSLPIDSPGDFSPDSPTCQACHQLPAAQRANSRVIETRGGAVLRTVIPVFNQRKCQTCHDPSHRINGVLMLDVSLDAVRAGVDEDLRWMVAVTGLLTLALIAGIAFLVRVVVLRRLQQFEATARSIASGDLDRRVPAHGSDTISWLAREFNTMADSMSGLLAEVNDQQQRLETVINSIDDGIVVIDPDRKVIAANRAFLQRTGRARDRVLGCHCRDSGVPGVCGVGDCPTVASLETGQRHVRICERRDADGRTTWEEVHASPIADAAGRVLQVVEVWRDISDRRAAEARLAESHRLASLGLLASGFSHELNTPLATVLTCLEGILGDARALDASGRTAVEDRATVAREQLLRCRGITRHFLRLSRGQAAAPELVDLPSALAAACRLVEPTAREQGVRLILPPSLPARHILADEAELQHVVINLLLNAVQASRPGSDVRVEVEAGDPIRIRIADQGCGIRPEHLGSIFEPFFSARSGGTGLGLFLSLTFVRHWGGDLTVASEPGVGSVFEIRMPAADTREARTA